MYNSKDNNRNSTKAKKLSLSGILLALTIITLFVATIMPTNRLSLYALSSFFISIVVIEFGMKTGWVFYVSSCILSLIVVQNKVELIPYIIFFGVYGLAKSYIESLDKIVLEYILKMVLFNVCLFVSLFFIKEFFLSNFDIKFPLGAIIILLQIVFVVYDYVYTLFIRYYDVKLRKMLRI